MLIDVLRYLEQPGGKLMLAGTEPVTVEVGMIAGRRSWNFHIVTRLLNKTVYNISNF